MPGENGQEVELLELNVPRSWTKLITWATNVMPYSQICVQIVNGSPGKLIWQHTFQDMRFDKEMSVPAQSPIDFSSLEDSGEKEPVKRVRKKKEPDIIVMKVSQAWIRLIYFCQKTLTNGTLAFQVIHGQPNRLVKELMDYDIDFSMDTLLPSYYMNFRDVAKNLSKEFSPRA